MSIGYLPRLDGVRCLAVLMVIAAHFASSLAKHISANFYGVNLFFVLSGFLITTILLSDKVNNFKNSYLRFVLRRSLRIFPSYYLSIFIFYIFISDEMRSDLVYLLTYTYNYFIDDSKSLPTHVFYWSLSVEEQFYLFFPLIVIPLKNNIKFLKVIFTLIIIVSFLQVYFNLFGISKYNWVGLLTNMAPLTIGAFGALVNKNNKFIKLIFANLYLEIILISVLIFVLNTHIYKYMILFSSLINLYIILKASIFYFQLNFINTLLLNKHIRYIGKVSYGIYLYHGLVGKYSNKYIFQPIWDSIPFHKFPIFSFLYDWDWIFRFSLIVGLSVLIASISYNFFEIYFLKLKDRIKV
jgi:peptidoglycan/LPS O-acetylase OafA/YrhL